MRKLLWWLWFGGGLAAGLHVLIHCWQLLRHGDAALVTVALLTFELSWLSETVARTSGHGEAGWS